MSLLELKIKKSKEVIDEAYNRFEKLATLWDTGKDSTLLLFLTRQMDKNIPVLFIDTTQHFKETYEFRDQLAEKWNLNLVNILPEVSYEEFKDDKERCCQHLKALPILKKISELNLDAVFVGIRWTLNPLYSREDYFSKRENHYRVHPILHWTEEDVGNFLKEHEIPHNPLYEKGYERIGCKPCTTPGPSKLPERLESDREKEEIMKRLKALGYW